MTQAIAWVAAKVGEWVGMTVFQAATEAGASVTTAATLANAAAVVAQATVYVAAAVGLGAIFSPKPPSAELGQMSFKGTMAPRRRAYGRVRLGFAAYCLYEAKGNVSYDVGYIGEGPIDGVELYYLHDDNVTVGGDHWVASFAGSRYGPNHVWIETRLGLPTETAYSTIVDQLPGVWTSDHRGDGVVTAALLCNTGERKYFNEDYPYGLPQLTLVLRGAKVFDWRDPAQDADDPGTWTWSTNLALIVRDYLCHESGFGYDHAEVIAPYLDLWTAAADACDEDVALKAGGTEKRYHGSGFYDFSNDPVEVLSGMLDACDGWLGEVDGALILRVGKYYEPTVTIADEHVEGYSLQRFVEVERMVNVLEVSFVSPDHKFTTVPAGEWRDEADIAAAGREVRQPLPLPWCASYKQAMRIAKRKMLRMNAEQQGSLILGPYGVKVLGERFIRVQLSELPTPLDAVFEVVGDPIRDLVAGTVTIPVVQVDPVALEAWNPATEEGSGPSGEAIASVPPTITPVPTIVAGAAFQEDVSDGVTITRTRFAIANPDRADLSVAWRWRQVGLTVWTYGETEDLPETGDWIVETGAVPSGTVIEFQAAFVAGAQGDWSASWALSTAAADVVGGVLDFSIPEDANLLVFA